MGDVFGSMNLGVAHSLISAALLAEGGALAPAQPPTLLGLLKPWRGACVGGGQLVSQGSQEMRGNCPRVCSVGNDLGV